MTNGSTQKNALHIEQSIPRINADEVSKETNEVGERRRNVYNDGKDMQLTDDLVLLQSQLAENEERLADVQQLLQMNKEQKMVLVPAIAQMHSSVHGISKDNVILLTYSKLECKIDGIYAEFEELLQQKLRCKEKIRKANNTHHTIMETRCQEKSAEVFEHQVTLQKSSQLPVPNQHAEDIVRLEGEIKLQALELQDKNEALKVLKEDFENVKAEVNLLKSSLKQKDDLSDTADIEYDELSEHNANIITVKKMDEIVRRRTQNLPKEHRFDLKNALDLITQNHRIMLTRSAFADFRFHASDSSIIITWVKPDSETEQKGLKKGDRVIKFNERPVSVGDSDVFIGSSLDPYLSDPTFTITVRPYSNVVRSCAIISKAIAETEGDAKR